MKTINQLYIGQKATITGFSDENISLVLNELGFFLGETIELASIAPMGDPICIKSQETLISIRESEAKSIQIKPLP